MFRLVYFRLFLTNIYLIILFWSTPSYTFAQQNVFINHINIDSKTISFANAYKENSSQHLPYYLHRFNVNGEDFDVQISNITYKKTAIDLIYSKDISADLIISKFINKEKKTTKGNVIINPYRLLNGEIEIIESFTINIVEQNKNAFKIGEAQESYSNSSVLANGKWYKFGVTEAGLYKLDFAFLKQLGIDVSAINPNNIKIYGHGGGMLPELAGSPKTDDLEQYAIKVVSANNSSFQNGDYILVYAPGPNSWQYDNVKQQFKFTKHLYSNTQNLFITTDGGIGKRVDNVNGNLLTENYTSNSYDAIAFIEEEKENLALSGRVFLGDRFTNQTVRSYSFNFPNVISSAGIKVWTNLVAVSSTNSSIQITEGNNLRNVSLNSLTQEYPGIFRFGMPKEDNFTFNNPTSNFTLKYTYQTNDFAGKTFLDYINVQARCNLVYNGSPLYFRDIQTVANNRITKFSINNINSNVQIWDITNPFEAKNINYIIQGNQAIFTINTDSLKEFAVFENISKKPIPLGEVPNQNLHALPQQDYIIITRKKLLPYAEELAQLHRMKENLQVVVVDIEQIFNEFSSGTNDITAIRNFVKMLYDRATQTTELPKYLLLFGDGTYNNKELGEYYLPTYQSKNSFSALQTFTTDDYFGILDDNEGNNIENTSTNLIDIGVGRIPVDNTEKAQNIVSKIKEYYSTNSFGDWRSQITFLADDEDNNLHFMQADNIAESTKILMPKYNIDKIYLDAFPQQNSISGSAYPAANNVLNSKITSGTLIINYVGHGGGSGLAQEGIVTIPIIESWNNTSKLPIFVTATCEFTRFDEPPQFSAGERLLLKKSGGAVALLSTTRLVFANENFDMNKNFMQQLAIASTQNNATIGNIIKEAKRNTFTGDGNRKFSLFGDPAMPIAFPKNNVVITSINNQATDTLKALKNMTIKGEITDNNNNTITNFNGTATITIYDKEKSINTLGNDPQSQIASFKLQKNKIIRTKTSVSNGQFQINFIVPKDIDYSFGFGKISTYASTNTTDALGVNNNVIVGGFDTTTITDNKGPEIQPFMNDENFVFGGMTDGNPILLLNLFDENGINTTGNGIGHDITAILDNNTKNIYILNDFYEPELNNLKNGKVSFPFSKLNKGRHTLNIKAWDIFNNSGEAYTEFIVEESASLALAHVLNYPNPFTTKTTFMLEHNKPNQELHLRIDIFSVSGKIVKTIQQNINTIGYRISDIIWDGKDEYGDNIARGVYVYKVTLKDNFGGKVSQYQKLVILN